MRSGIVFARKIIRTNLLKGHKETKNMCEHKNIIITRKERYEIPQGWAWINGQEDVDLGEYYIGDSEEVIFCEDCGEYLIY